MKIKGFVLDLINGTAEPREIEPTLSAYYDACNCDLIDIVTREVGGHEFAIVCDDEALLKGDAKPSAFSVGYEPMLFGNLLFFNIGDDNDLVGLTEEEIAILNQHLTRMVDVRNGHNWLAVMDMGY